MCSSIWVQGTVQGSGIHPNFSRIMIWTRVECWAVVLWMGNFESCGAKLVELIFLWLERRYPVNREPKHRWWTLKLLLMLHHQCVDVSDPKSYKGNTTQSSFVVFQMSVSYLLSQISIETQLISICGIASSLLPVVFLRASFSTSCFCFWLCEKGSSKMSLSVKRGVLKETNGCPLFSCLPNAFFHGTMVWKRIILSFLTAGSKITQK